MCGRTYFTLPLDSGNLWISTILDPHLFYNTTDSFFLSFFFEIQSLVIRSGKCGNILIFDGFIDNIKLFGMIFP